MSKILKIMALSSNGEAMYLFTRTLTNTLIYFYSSAEVSRTIKMKPKHIFCVIMN